MNIQAYGRIMEQIGAARQRLYDQASAQGSAGGSAPTAGQGFPAAQQLQPGGTSCPADPAASTAAGATSSTGTTAAAAGGTQPSAQEAKPHHHHHHHGGGAGSMFSGDTLGALLGGQEHAGQSTASASQDGTGGSTGSAAAGPTGGTGLFASIESAVTKATSSYYAQNAPTQAASPATTTTA